MMISIEGAQQIRNNPTYAPLLFVDESQLDGGFLTDSAFGSL
jgi:hypothetical protein